MYGASAFPWWFVKARRIPPVVIGRTRYFAARFFAAWMTDRATRVVRAPWRFWF